VVFFYAFTLFVFETGWGLLFSCNFSKGEIKL